VEFPTFTPARLAAGWPGQDFAGNRSTAQRDREKTISPSKKGGGKRIAGVVIIYHNNGIG